VRSTATLRNQTLNLKLRRRITKGVTFGTAALAAGHRQTTGPESTQLGQLITATPQV